jgi:hypothetical protein
MSIQETFHKIKRGLEAYNSMPIHLFIITLVGFSSFFLGRLSINTDYSNGQIKGDNIAINEVKGSQNFAPKEIKIKSTSSLPTTNTGQGEYLASKNGKLYYPKGCKGANRIKEENRVWFDTSTDAEKQGYTRASSCK